MLGAPPPNSSAWKRPKALSAAATASARTPSTIVLPSGRGAAGQNHAHDVAPGHADAGRLEAVSGLAAVAVAVAAVPYVAVAGGKSPRFPSCWGRGHAARHDTSQRRPPAAPTGHMTLSAAVPCLSTAACVAMAAAACCSRAMAA
ncbi:hypothetical protein ACCO45_005335 [Purpureocillium lilacinum]|uniref:Uncharacterized protein n=1 Tax=Purpureocillium lilacinum TaxID=33203 RepID=A0ACC4DY68_PURLI